MQSGLYIHIPFCASKCFYCDFLSFPGSKLQEAYVEALIEEIKATKESLGKGITIKSIFIGGGTPTVLPPLLLGKIAEAIVKHFELEADVEWTIEANPGTLNEELVNVLKQYPITRISMGLQSTHDDLLKQIGRIHTFKDFEESVALIRRETNWQINADLMFALPNQSFEAFKESLEKIVTYDLEHLSVYALIVEEGTRFGDLAEKGQLKTVDEELDRKMYHFAQSYLATKGYEQYEISNWAKPGKKCKHNMVYWKLEPYLGLGLGAHALFKKCRYYNEENVQKYIDAHGDLNKLRYMEEDLTLEHEMQEFMFLGLRLLEGISVSDFEKRFGRSLWEVYDDIINKWIKYDLLVKTNDRIHLSAYGIDVCNEVFASFL